MNVLSLFSGIGGLDLGLERAGMTVVGQVEIDPWCRTILSKHWPEVPRHDDVRTCVEWWDGRPVDLVCGGFPCQPVSLAGKGLAQADSRWLWPAFADIIRELRPRYALMENVPGLLGRGLGDVLGDLASLGYDAEWDCVPAAFFGAPHIRNRVFIVAYPAGARRASGQPGESGPVRDEARRPKPERRSRDVADAARDRWPSEGERPATGHADRRSHLRRARQASHDSDTDSTAGQSAWPASRTVFQPSPVERPRRLRSSDRHTWPVEPDVGRVAHGIPRRLDRLRGLGNAVVPQVAEHIGRLIMNAEATP